MNQPLSIRPALVVGFAALCVLPPARAQWGSKCQQSGGSWCGWSRSDVDCFEHLLIDNGINAGQPIPLSLLVDAQGRARVFHTCVPGHHTFDQSVLFTVYGGPGFDPVANPDGGWIKRPDVREISLGVPDLLYRFDAGAVPNAYRPDDLGDPNEPIVPGTWVYVAGYANDEGANNQSNGCDPISRFSESIATLLRSPPNWFPGPGTRGLTMHCAGDIDLPTGTEGSDLAIQPFLDGLTADLNPAVPATVGGVPVPPMKISCGMPNSMPYSRTVFYTSPFGPCRGTRRMWRPGSPPTTPDLTMDSICAGTFPKFRCLNVSARDGVLSAGGQAVVTVRVANGGTGEAEVEVRLTAEPPVFLAPASTRVRVPGVRAGAPPFEMDVEVLASVHGNAFGPVTVRAELSAQPPYDALPFGLAPFEVVLPAQSSSAVLAAAPMDEVEWLQRFPPAAPPRRRFSALAFDYSRGKAVLFGGEDHESTTLGDTWEWDGARWSRFAPPLSPTARFRHALVYDPARGRVVLFGGVTQSNASLRDTWEWDGSSWTQRQPASPPPSRFRTALAFDEARRRVVLFGGTNEFNVVFNDTWEWDGTTWTRRTPATSPPLRYGHALEYDWRLGRTVLFGGYSGTNELGDTWEWDGTNWTRRTPGSSPAAREGHRMAYDPDRAQTTLFGGLDFPDFFSDTWEWDGTDWRGASRLPAPRRNHALAYQAARGRTLLFGGSLATGGTGPGETWEWDGMKWVQRLPVQRPSSRLGHAMADDPARGRVILFGGQPVGQTGLLSDTWEWDGVNWIQRTVFPSPIARTQGALAVDTARGRAVLFGGINGTTPLNDTLEWDGTRWEARSPASRPLARSAHTMAYDVARQRTVLFGGIAGAPLGDTWEWDGTTWTQRATTGPSPRSGAQLAWHPGIGRVVLFGGRSTSMLSDSWAWDGTVWTPLPAAGGPAPRASHALAFDALRGRLVLFGGELESLPRAGDTWEWDGTSWAPRARAVAPPARTEPAMAFDLIRQRMVLFGGESPSSGPFGDTWEYLASRSIVGPGHAEGGLALVCEPQPQAGVTCCLRFPSTQSSAVLLFWNAPPLSAPLPLAPPGMCRAGLLYPVPALPIPAPGNPATVCFPIPAVPQAVGLSFCVQGLVLQPGNCGLVTDAMVMTIQP